MPSGTSGAFPKLGVAFRGPNDKDYSILGSILGSPHFGKLPSSLQKPLSPHVLRHPCRFSMWARYSLSVTDRGNYLQAHTCS